jgi:chorismate dehydratase
VTRWRLGSVPFLNERPLTYALESHPDVTLEWHPPGPLADMLAAGEFDAALIPVAEQLRLGLTAIGSLGIACRGPVESVRVWHDAPLASLTRILVPAHSRSSVMLLRLLLPHWGCPAAELVPTDYPADLATPPDEPALIFGDAALRCLTADRPSTDLGAAWKEMTGLPFVFARWAARPGLPVSGPEERELEELLMEGFVTGMERLSAIAIESGQERGISGPTATQYLSHSIAYLLTTEFETGQDEFADRARAAGLLDQ